ncbi:MAG: DUF1931 domain-containing protein [Nitrospirota bacterium]
MEFVTKNNVKTFLKENKKRVATDTYEELNRKVEVVLKKACERAEKNGRSTVMPQDL